MARCGRCNKFSLFGFKSGYCANCESIMAQEEAERQRQAEAERRRQEAERQRKAEEERRRKEEAERQRKAEEERRRKEEEATRQARLEHANPSIEDAIRYWCWCHNYNINDDDLIWSGLRAFSEHIETLSRTGLASFAESLKDDYKRDVLNGIYCPPNKDAIDMSFNGFARMANPVDIASLHFRRTLSNHGLESVIFTFRHRDPTGFFPF